MSDAAASEAAIAAELAAARRDARALPRFPGTPPADLDAAYRIQRQAVTTLGIDVIGWKAAAVPADRQATLGRSRVFGPMLAGTLADVGGSAPIAMPAIAGGYAAFEAEIVVRLARDADRGVSPAAVIGSVHVGAEFAGSPIAADSSPGLTETTAAFANNAGLCLGPVLDDPEAARWRVAVNGELRSEAGAGDWRGAFAATLAHADANGMPLCAGDLVSTGAIGGPHRVVPGDVVELSVTQGAVVHLLRFVVVVAPPWPDAAFAGDPS